MQLALTDCGVTTVDSTVIFVHNVTTRSKIIDKTVSMHSWTV